ncbi:hypothetical protein [Ramlibacter sp. 2FC]|uniref:hypothetical protein n=1 Tax=Ramlibacter sp. 2FC TaxID=2502188 RepID=UPI0010F95579|nr:hypothetical protein [Ramlibacter sp. 2FC]
MTPRLTLAELQRIKQWHVDHRAQHPLEYHLWDAVLTVWLLGWTGWLPALVLDEAWALPLCPIAILSPALYVAWRARAHMMRRVRCDWLSGPGQGR